MNELRIGFDVVAEDLELQRSRLSSFSESFYTLFQLILLNFHPDSGGADEVIEMRYERDQV